MKAKKTNIIFCIGLLVTFLNDAVTGTFDLLTSTEALRFIPEYTKIKGENGEGQLLTYNLINTESRVVLYDHKVEDGIDLRRITFEVDDSHIRKSFLAGISTRASKQCGGSPRVKVQCQQKCTKKTLNCVTRKVKRCIWDSPFYEYCYKGIHIDFLKEWEFAIQLMRLKVVFYDTKKDNLLGVHIIILKEPSNQEDIQRMKKHGAFYSDGLTKALSKLTIGGRGKGVGKVFKENDMSWMKDVLDRAKFYYVTKVNGRKQTQSDWYYAGVLMVKPEILIKILQFDKRWERYIEKAPAMK